MFPYTVYPIDITKDEQLAPKFLKIALNENDKEKTEPRKGPGLGTCRRGSRHNFQRGNMLRAGNLGGYVAGATATLQYAKHDLAHQGMVVACQPCVIANC
jgi:hypothetical protein